jgi:hypothetical protein
MLMAHVLKYCSMFVITKYATCHRLIVGNSDIICSYWLDETDVMCTDNMLMYCNYDSIRIPCIGSTTVQQFDIMFATRISLISLCDDTIIPVTPQPVLQKCVLELSFGVYRRVILSAELYAAAETFMRDVFDKLY